jgi:phytoene dehydrogenase-like protein
MTTADPTRSPPGTESAWAYTHVPFRVQDGAGMRPITGDEIARVVDRIEDRVERHAPGFRGRIVARHVLPPAELERRDANLVEGDNAGGTNQLHQQLVFRPLPGLGRPATPIRRLYLASASAHPGGGVHGACGANAARAALAAHRVRRAVPGRTSR